MDDHRLDAELDSARTATQSRRIQELTRRLQSAPSRPAISPRHDSVARIPLSFAQQRLWFLEQVFDMRHAYNVCNATRLRGKLDIAALENSLSEVVHRHESLRTTFAMIGDEPCQVIDRPRPVHLELLDLSALPAASRDERVSARMQQDIETRFALETGPLMRASLLRISEHEHALLITFHHIVTDGWSNQVLWKELAALYPAYCTGTTPILPELKFQYADFAIWERERFQGALLERQLAYWLDHLRLAPAHLNLPTDRPRPPVQSHKGAAHSFDLAAQLAAPLRAIAMRNNATIYMLLLSAFLTVLYRWSGETDIVVGSTVSGGRLQSGTEHLMGLFVNTLALRADLSGSPPFSTLLKRIKRVTLGALAHADMPFQRIVQELRPPRNLARQPIFQVEFTLQISTNMLWRRREFQASGFKFAAGTGFVVGGLEVEPLPQRHSSSKFDLCCTLYEKSDGGYAGLMEYAADLFDPGTMNAAAASFQYVLESIAADQEILIGNVPMIDLPRSC